MRVSDEINNYCVALEAGTMPDADAIDHLWGVRTDAEKMEKLLDELKAEVEALAHSRSAYQAKSDRLLMKIQTQWVSTELLEEMFYFLEPDSVAMRQAQVILEARKEAKNDDNTG